MAGLRWMVVLTVFLSAGDGSAAVDQNWLKSVVEGIKKEYALGGTFSLAVNVPENQDINNLQEVFQGDPAETVKQTVSGGQVYQGTRVVAAAQAESVSRVLENIQTLTPSSQGNFLVIYSEDFSCCPTSANGIADKVNDIIQRWNGYAYVFSKVPDVSVADTSQLAESFKQLAIFKLGLENIFRCYEPGADPFQCTSCYSGGEVTPSCVANDAPSSTVPPTGTDTGKETAPGGGIGPGIATGGGGGTREGKVWWHNKHRGGYGLGKGPQVWWHNKHRGYGLGKGPQVWWHNKHRGGYGLGKGVQVLWHKKHRGGFGLGKGAQVSWHNKHRGGFGLGKGAQVSWHNKHRGGFGLGKGGKVSWHNKHRGGWHGGWHG